MSDKLTKADVLAKAVREYLQWVPHNAKLGTNLLVSALEAYEAAPAKVREHLPYGSFQHDLFYLMYREHGLTLLETEMNEIRAVCRGIDNAYVMPNKSKGKTR